MVPGVELENYATGHEMLNEQSEKQSFPNTTQNWIGLGKLVDTYNFAASPFFRSTISIWDHLDHGSWLLSQTCDSCAVAFAVEFFGTLLSQRQQCKSCKWPRPGWLPRQANLPVHHGWRRTWQMCHWPWNFESIIRKAKLPKHKPGSPWEN